MRIGLDVTQTVKRDGRGIARYIRSVTPYLGQADPSLDLSIYIRGSRWWRRHLINDWMPSVKRSWLAVPDLLIPTNLDLFHSFGNHLPAISSVPRTFTIHDFRALDRSWDEAGTGNRLRRNIERSQGIICLTNHGKSRLLEHSPNYSEANISVIAHGVDHEYFCPQTSEVKNDVRKKYGLDRPFLLQLGSWFPHKNIELSIRAFSQSRAFKDGFNLVFVGGGASSDYRKSLQALAQSNGVEDSLVWIESVPGADLPGFLGAAHCLLQPSRYEGFALPLLEAMAVGIPGVVSSASCLPEVSAGIWPIVGLDDVEGFALAIDSMALDETLRIEKIVAGLKHAGSFTWEKTAEQTADFFKKVLS